MAEEQIKDPVKDPETAPVEGAVKVPTDAQVRDQADKLAMVLGSLQIELARASGLVENALQDIKNVNTEAEAIAFNDKYDKLFTDFKYLDIKSN